MKRTFAVFLALLAACASGGEPGAGETASEFELAVISKLAFDVTALKPGEWALYKVQIRGERDAKYMKYSVVEEDRQGLWIENKVPSSTGQFVLKSKYDRKGTLLEHWRGEPGSLQPAKLFPSDRKGEAPTPVRDPSTADPKITEQQDEVTLGGKTYLCTKVTTTLTYRDNRRSTLTDWYSKDVPFSIVMGAKSYGGLVKRQFGLVTLELVAHDNKGAMAELKIPRQ